MMLKATRGGFSAAETGATPVEGPALARQVVLAALRERTLAFAASRLGRDVAEDLTQDVLMLLVEKYPAVEHAEDLVPLSLKILRFKMASYWRRVRRRGEDTASPVDELDLRAPGLSPAELAERSQLAERIETAAAHLEPRCQTILRMRLEGYSFAEIRTHLRAAATGTVHTWDFRCRQKLLALVHQGTGEGRP
jgi:RNA polymerase sigma-70 factor (ECF subfamily)